MTLLPACLSCIFTAILSLSALTSLSAQDRVTVQTANGGRIGMSCFILDYTGRELVYQQKLNGPTRRMVRRDVLDVVTQYTPAHEEGRKLLAEGSAKAAFDKLTTALDEEERTWVRREILATQIKCALWDGNRISAGERFLALFDSDPETLYFGLVPLSWSDDPPTGELASAAKRWLSQTKHSAARLLGASHLLTDPAQAEGAQTALKHLVRDENPEIQRFAQYQLWRVKVLAGDVRREELSRWERALDEVQEAAGGGPRYVLGLGYHREHDDLAAAAAWLYLPLAAADDRWLAAQAGWNAVKSLDHAGQKSAAVALSAEFTARFADTPFSPRSADVRQRRSPDAPRRDTTKPSK